MNDLTRVWLRWGWTVLLAAGFQAVPVYAEPTKDPGDVRRVMLGPDMDDLQRYHLPPAQEFAMPLKPVTRQTYLEFLQRAPSHGGGMLYSEAIVKNPKRGQYGPRHAFPALALFAGTGDKKLGQAVKSSLQDFCKVVKETVEKDPKGDVWYMHEPPLIELEFRILAEKGILTAEDEPWMKDLIAVLNRNIHVWGTNENYWRGPRHRSQGEAMMKRLAIARYPDFPEAKEWLDYSETVWNDWWQFRDIACNDTGYSFGSLFPVVLGAHLLGRKEVFTDPEIMKFWEAWMYQVGPDGTMKPYGPSAGWNSGANDLLWMLELVSAHTRDGRFRWMAHRMMNAFEFHEKNLPANHILVHFTKLGVALAYFFADDSVQPVEPDASSKVLLRKETLRVRDKKAAANYLKDFDPAPDRGHVCCNLLATDKVLPHKLVFRSGWNPGDLFMLVELYPRHEPMNVTGIIGLSQYGVDTTMAFSSKELTDWHNMLQVEDLSGTATPTTNPNPHTADAYYQDVQEEEFSEHGLATYARVKVSDYCGFPITNTREFFFVKNRFVLVRDTAEFKEGFLVRLGPTWNTQNIGPQMGDHWANTYMDAPVFLGARLSNPAYPPLDLLVYHAPKSDRKLVTQDRSRGYSGWVPYSLRYMWQGITEPNQRVHFTQILLPHAPTRTPAALAEKVKVLKDTLEQTVIRLEAEDKRQEWLVLNPAGGICEVDSLRTDAKLAYLDFRDGTLARYLFRDATHLALDGKELFRKEQPTTEERK